MELALRSPGCARGHVNVLARERCICQLRFFHDFPPTSFTHFQSKHCIMQSTVPAGEGNWILFCVFSSQVFCLFFFNLSRADFTSPSAERFLWMVPWLLHWEKQEFWFFFSGNKSSLLIKSILNLCDFLKYYLPGVFAVGSSPCSNHSSILWCIPAKDLCVSSLGWEFCSTISSLILIAK